MVHYHNKFTETPEMYQEIKWKLFNWKLVGLVSGILFAFAAGLIYAGILAVHQNNNIAAAYSFFIAFAIILSWALVIPEKIISVFKNKKDFLNIEVQFDDECIKLISNSEVKKQTSYKNIKKVKESQNYYLIIFENEEKLLSYLPIKKDAFLTQSENFIDFINNKNVKL